MDKADKPDALLINNNELCALLGICDQHLLNLRASGRFPVKPIRLGRSVRYNRRQVESWIESGCSTSWRPGR